MLTATDGQATEGSRLPAYRVAEREEQMSTIRKKAKRLATWLLSLTMLTSGLASGSMTAWAAEEETIIKDWSFDQGLEGWYYGEGWDDSYHGTKPCKVDSEGGMLRLDVDYSHDAENGWAQIAVCSWNEPGLNLSGANHTSIDILYETDKLTEGQLKIKVYSNDAAVDTDITLDTKGAESIGDGKSKLTAELSFNEISASAVKDWAVCVVGCNTSYKGAIWLDNVKLSKTAGQTGTETGSSADNSSDVVYVDATVTPQDDRVITISNQQVTTYDKEGKEKQTALPATIQLADPDATASVRQLYAYLEAIGQSDSVIFGHQNSTWHKAGAIDSPSDIYDVTGAYAGIVGMDTLSLTGNEYGVAKHNQMFPDQTLTDTPQNRVKAAAHLANWNLAQGSIVTLSSHMPNFSGVKTQTAKSTEPSYAAYDFNEYTPNVLTGDVANEILPEGKYNAAYSAFLDMIADFAHQVDGAILFRPFHENTGSWFWWGKAFCDSETFKNLYRYTVEYLRDEKDVHNLLYVYGPGSEAESETDYAERYPGDAYVDMVGFDMYHSAPHDKSDTWISQFTTELQLVCDFAEKHGKLAAVTETGVAEPELSDTPDKALRRSGNTYQDWYQDILDIVSPSRASYFLVWANFGESSGGFYTPYVKSVQNGVKRGHEMMDAFIRFFNDPRSVFASNQKAALSSKELEVPASSPQSKLNGYIVSPVGGKRMTEACQLVARVTGSAEQVTFQLTGASGSKTLTTTKDADAPYYRASLTQADLISLGESATGQIELMADGQTLSRQKEIFNIPEPKKDPYLIDNFDLYGGSADLMLREWATNKATGCTITLSLEDTNAQENQALKFDYTENAEGWAGATITKKVDWSDCNALRFWTIPDGKQQKTVVQISANGTCYEVYLNLYDAYNARAGQPTLVTIPFSEFCQRDTDGNPKGGLAKDCGSIETFGLWVNAIDNEAFVDGTVSGSIWYDNITAVTADETEPSFESPSSSDDREAAESSVPDQAAQPIAYTDVPSDSACFDAVQYVSGRGLMTGVAPQTFAPDTAVNHAMLYTILARLDGADPSGGTVWYEKAIDWAISKAIYEDGNVRSDMTVEQMVATLWRYAGSPTASGSLEPFADSHMVSAGAVDAMRWAVEQNLLTIVGDNLEPQKTVTRAEVAAILMRFCQMA